MALSGLPGEPPLLAPAPLATRAREAGEALGVLSGAEALAQLDAAALLGERAALFELERQGARSPGGSCRLLEAADGWLALNLARPDDAALLPAWLGEGDASDPWAFAAERVARGSVDALVERGRLLGLPLAPASNPPRESPPWARIAARGPSRERGASQLPLVVDLSALWAGPLCAHLLQLAGAPVVKVESTRRPDGARFGAEGLPRSAKRRQAERGARFRHARGTGSAPAPAGARRHRGGERAAARSGPAGHRGGGAGSNGSGPHLGEHHRLRPASTRRQLGGVRRRRRGGRGAGGGQRRAGRSADLLRRRHRRPAGGPARGAGWRWPPSGVAAGTCSTWRCATSWLTCWCGAGARARPVSSARARAGRSRRGRRARRCCRRARERRGAAHAASVPIPRRCSPSLALRADHPRGGGGPRAPRRAPRGRADRGAWPRSRARAGRGAPRRRGWRAAAGPSRPPPASVRAGGGGHVRALRAACGARPRRAGQRATRREPGGRLDPRRRLSRDRGRRPRPPRARRSRARLPRARFSTAAARSGW